MEQFKIGGWIKCIAEAKSNKSEFCNQFKLGEYYQIRQTYDGYLETIEGYKLTIKANSQYDLECEWVGMERPMAYSPEVERLLIEAKRRFPIGTVYSPAHLESTIKCNVYSHDFKWNEHGEMITLGPGNYEKNGHGFSEVLYRAGKWANIIIMEEEKPKIMYKFKIGESVKVIASGQGVAGEHVGKIVEIVEQGLYCGKPGYKTAPAIGNVLTGNYGGFIEEPTFEKYIGNKKEEFKTGDWVEILQGIRNWASDMDNWVGKRLQLGEKIGSNAFKIPDTNGWSWCFTDGHFKRAKAPIKEEKSDLQARKELALERYPKGTVYVGLRDGRNAVSNGRIEVCNSSGISMGFDWVWKPEKGWAEIVSKPSAILEEKSPEPLHFYGLETFSLPDEEIYNGVEKLPSEIIVKRGKKEKRRRLI